MHIPEWTSEIKPQPDELLKANLERRGGDLRTGQFVEVATPAITKSNMAKCVPQ